jgi:DNA-repair protein XRCC1
MDLPDFLSDCRFLLYGDYSVNDRRTITRYITAYKGKIENYMSDVVTHVVSQDKWDENFDQAVAENSSLIFVKPQWIFACHSKSTKVPHQPYTIAPQ